MGGDQDLRARGGDGGAGVSHPRWEDAKGRSCSRGAGRGGGRHALSPGRGGDHSRPAYLPGSEGHLAVLAFAQLSQLVKDGG